MPDDKLYRKVRVFISCPSDVGPERLRLITVIREDLDWLADNLGITLDILDWPNVTPGAGRPEQVILDQLRPTSWDVFVGIMWHRFGTRPHKSSHKATEVYYSGTEEEFRAAYGLWETHKRPRVMFYKCQRDTPQDSLNPNQFKRVQRFFNGFSPDGRHPGFYHEYKEVGDFERAVRRHLGQLLFEYWTQFNVAARRGRKAASGKTKKTSKAAANKSAKRPAKKSAAATSVGGKNRKR